jgi:hypothetical protein
MSKDNGQTGSRVGCDGEADSPPSRAKDLASRGNPQSPEDLFRLGGAMLTDALRGALTSQQINPACRALQATISVALNVEPLDAMYTRIEAQDQQRASQEADRAKQQEIASLRQRLAQLTS